ncbi:hypothetical protein Tco_1303302 [Tanacetum coccineum]
MGATMFGGCLGGACMVEIGVSWLMMGGGAPVGGRNPTGSGVGAPVYERRWRRVYVYARVMRKMRFVDDSALEKSGASYGVNNVLPSSSAESS